MNDTMKDRVPARFGRILPLAAAALWLAPAPVPADEEAPALEPIEPRQVWAGLELNVPVQVVVPPDGSDRLFLVQQRGQILILPNDRESTDTKTFLDISDRDLEENKFEEGLLNLTFHPQFSDNRRLFTFHTEQKPKRIIVTEWLVDEDDGDRIDPDSERVLLEVRQPFWNHNSGNMLFGPDDMLYVAIGDGGRRDDPLNLAQNTFSLMGKILRIDVDSTYGALPYGIPEDNPFYGKDAHLGEIYALGLRNPWGIYFDEDGDFWVADVGQDLWEEINLVEAGGNYGWNFREGAREFPQRPADPPADLELIDPIHEYSHADGISITGGLVYPGGRRDDLAGWYVYGDWGTGRMWALKYDKEAGEVVSNQLILETIIDGQGRGQIQPTAYCFDEHGEILILCWKGAIYELH